MIRVSKAAVFAHYNKFQFMGLPRSSNNFFLLNFIYFFFNIFKCLGKSLKKSDAEPYCRCVRTCLEVSNGWTDGLREEFCYRDARGHLKQFNQRRQRLFAGLFFG